MNETGNVDITRIVSEMMAKAQVSIGAGTQLRWIGSARSVSDLLKMSAASKSYWRRFCGLVVDDSREPPERTAARTSASIRRHWKLSKERADRVGHIFRSGLLNRRPPGPAPDADTILASNLYSVGLRVYTELNDGPWPAYLVGLWARIKGKVIPGFAGMDLANKQFHGDKLRNKVKAWRKRKHLPLRPKPPKPPEIAEGQM